MNSSYIINLLLLRVPEEIPGAHLWRANVLAAKVRDRFIRAGIKGQSDLIGITPNGKFLAVEVKAGKDRMRPEQEAFRRMILECGGVHVIARDVDAAIAEIRSALAVSA